MDEHKCAPLIKRLAATGLINEARLQKIEQALQPETTPQQLASSLVKKNWLTAWQLEQLTSGRETFRYGNYIVEGSLMQDPTCPFKIYSARKEGSKERFEVAVLERSSELGEDAYEQVVSLRERLVDFEHPNTVPTLDVIEDGKQVAIVSPLIETHSLSPSNLSRQESLTILRDLALAWSHANSLSLYSPLLSSECLVVDRQGKFRVRRFGLSAWHQYDSMGAERWQELEVKRPKDDTIPLEVRKDLARLAQLGRWMLTGNPSSTTDDDQADPVLDLLDKLCPKDGPSKLGSMSGVVKRLNKLVGKDSTETATPTVDPVAEDEYAVAPAIEIATEHRKSRPFPEIQESTFALGPKSNLDDDDELDDSTKKSAIPLPVLIVAPIAALMILGATITIVVMSLSSTGKKGTSLAQQDVPKIVAQSAGGSDQSQQNGLVSNTSVQGRQNTNVPTNSENDDEAAVDDASTNDPSTNDNEAGNEEDNATSPNQASETNAADGGANDGDSNDDGAPATNNSDDANPVNAGENKENNADSGSPPDEVAQPDNLANNDAANENNAANEAAEMKEEQPEPAPKKALADLPQIFSLPERGTEEAPADGYDQQVVIGKVSISEFDLLFVELLGGEKAYRGRNEFALKTINDSPTNYQGEILIKEREASEADGKSIAKLSLSDGELRFQWLPESLTGGPIDYLQNCMITLRTGTDLAGIALRNPIQIEPLTLAGTEAKGKTEVKLDFLPRPETVRVQVLPLSDDFPDYQFRENINSAGAAKGSVFLDLAGLNDSSFFGRLDVTNRSKLQANYGTYVQNGNRFDALNPELIQRQLAEIQQFVLNAEQQLRNFDALPQDQQQRLLGQRQNLQAQLNRANAEKDRLTAVVNFANRFDGKQVPLRVYIDLGDFQVDLATPDGQPIPR